MRTRISRGTSIMEVIGLIFIGLVGTILLIVLAGIILGLPVMLLWNWLMPVIFSLPTITFFQAIGLNILFGILFRASSSTSKEK